MDLRHLAPTLTLLALAAAAGAQEVDPEKLARDVASPDAAVRQEAASQINRCGFDCRSAVPGLVKMFQSSEPGDRSEAGFALVQVLGAVQTRALMNNEGERASTADECQKALAVLRPRVRGAAPAPLEGQLAEVATFKLFGLCGEAEDVPSLVAVLSNPAFSVNARSAALVSLAGMGPSASAAVPAIKALGTNSADPQGAYLKTMAKDVLARIQPAPARARKK